MTERYQSCLLLTNAAGGVLQREYLVMLLEIDHQCPNVWARVFTSDQTLVHNILFTTWLRRTYSHDRGNHCQLELILWNITFKYDRLFLFFQYYHSLQAHCPIYLVNVASMSAGDVLASGKMHGKGTALSVSNYTLCSVCPLRLPWTLAVIHHIVNIHYAKLANALLVCM